MDLTIRPATPDDVPPLHRIRVEIEAWLAARGIAQWGHGHLSADRIGQQVAVGEWHVACVGSGGGPGAEASSGIVGGLRLLWADEEIWQQDHAFAAYVHGLVVDRSRAGHGLGAAMLDWAADRGRAAGAPVLRLDCVEGNAPLRAYYRRLGFTEVGRRDFTGPWLAATLLEKPLT